MHRPSAGPMKPFAPIDPPSRMTTALPDQTPYCRHAIPVSVTTDFMSHLGHKICSRGWGVSLSDKRILSSRRWPLQFSNTPGWSVEQRRGHSGGIVSPQRFLILRWEVRDLFHSILKGGIQDHALEQIRAGKSANSGVAALSPSWSEVSAASRPACHAPTFATTPRRPSEGDS